MSVDERHGNWTIAAGRHSIERVSIRPVIGRSMIGRSMIGRSMIGRPVIGRPVIGALVINRFAIWRPVVRTAVERGAERIDEILLCRGAVGGRGHGIHDRAVNLE